MRILGIDPGLKITGYAALDADDGVLHLVEAGAISTRESDSMEKRLSELYSGLCSVISALKPDTAAVEELYSHYAHPRTAILMGHARGVIFLAAGENDIEIASYSATRVKKSFTGNGHASKLQVGRMAQQIFGLNQPPTPNDVSDAIAVAACHALVCGRTQIKA